MAKDSRKVSSEEAVCAEEVTTLETLIRRRARGLIDAIVEEELEAALGAAESARVGPARQGYRHGTRERTLTTSLGQTTFAMPRARVRTAEGATAEWRSELVPRYQRRSERVDEAVLGVYLSGTNTRRIKGALAPLLRGGPLSKDAVSRLVGRLAGDFDTWRSRDLADETIQYLVMDGWFPKVRIGKRRVRVPALVAQARARFVRKWRLRCPAVADCLDEAGDHLYSFLSFPKAQWKALRTTNALERINGEFRRRTKTQASLPSQDAVLLLLFGLLRSGQVKMRRIDGWHEMERVQAAA